MVLKPTSLRGPFKPLSHWFMVNPFDSIWLARQFHQFSKKGQARRQPINGVPHTITLDKTNQLDNTVTFRTPDNKTLHSNDHNCPTIPLAVKTLADRVILQSTTLRLPSQHLQGQHRTQRSQSPRRETLCLLRGHGSLEVNLSDPPQRRRSATTQYPRQWSPRFRFRPPSRTSKRPTHSA